MPYAQCAATGRAGPGRARQWRLSSSGGVSADRRRRRGPDALRRARISVRFNYLCRDRSGSDCAQRLMTSAVCCVRPVGWSAMLLLLLLLLMLAMCWTASTAPYRPPNDAAFAVTKRQVHNTYTGRHIHMERQGRESKLWANKKRRRRWKCENDKVAADIDSSESLKLTYLN